MQYLRTGGRIPVELPVEIRWKGPGGKPRQAQGKTISISSNGVLLSVAADLRPQTAVTITVKLPLEFTKSPLVLYCHGRVLRLGPGAMTVSALIDDYKLRPAAQEKGKTSRKKK